MKRLKIAIAAIPAATTAAPAAAGRPRAALAAPMSVEIAAMNASPAAAPRYAQRALETNGSRVRTAEQTTNAAIAPSTALRDPVARRAAVRMAERRSRVRALVRPSVAV